jgi:hypothetical protein
MQAAYIGLDQVREIASRLRDGSNPLLLSGAGAAEPSTQEQSLASRLRSRLRRTR